MSKTYFHLNSFEIIDLNVSSSHLEMPRSMWRQSRNVFPRPTNVNMNRQWKSRMNLRRAYPVRERSLFLLTCDRRLIQRRVSRNTIGVVHHLFGNAEGQLYDNEHLLSKRRKISTNFYFIFCFSRLKTSLLIVSVHQGAFTKIKSINSLQNFSSPSLSFLSSSLATHDLLHSSGRTALGNETFNEKSLRKTVYLFFLSYRSLLRLSIIFSIGNHVSSSRHFANHLQC